MWSPRAGSCGLTLFEFLASFIKFSATFMSSRTGEVSVNFREFRWSCTLTHIVSIICTMGTERSEVTLRHNTPADTRSHLLSGGGDDALLQPVCLLLQVFTGFVVPQKILLHLQESVLLTKEPEPPTKPKPPEHKP